MIDSIEMIKSIPTNNEKTYLLSKKATALPKKQLALGLFIVLGDALIYTYIFSFLPFLVQDFMHFTDKSRIGYYAGFLGSTMEIGRFMGSPVWPILSNRIGCRRTMMFSLGLNIVCLLCFGLSSSFLFIVLIRLFQGLCCSLSLTKTYIANLSDSTNEKITFAWFSFFWTLGDIFGPVIGGTLWNPVNQYPSVFNENSIFSTFPYLLPSLSIVCLQLITFSFSCKFLIEPKSALSSVPLDCPNTSNNYLKHFQNPTTRIFFLIVLMTATICTSFDAAVPLWVESPTKLAGLGFEPNDIGLLQAICGVLSAFCTIIHYILLHRWGALIVFQFAAVVFAMTNFFPIIITGLNLQMYPLISWYLLVGMYSFRAVAYGAIFLSINLLAKHIVDPSQVGTAMGMVTSAMALGMAIGPYGMSSLYAWSISPAAARLLPFWLMQGRFTFVFFFSIQMIVLFLSFKIKKKQT